MSDVIVYTPATTVVIKKGISFTTTGKEINLTQLVERIKINGSIISYAQYKEGASVTTTPEDDFIRVSDLMRAIKEQSK